MLKQDIIKILQESLTDDQEEHEILAHIADRIIAEVVLKEVAKAVSSAITVYVEGGK